MSEDEDWIDDAVDESWKIIEQRNNAEYDGVLGLPPAWMPDPLVQEFRVTRNKLLDGGLSQKEIKSFMEGRAFMFDLDIERPPLVPANIIPSIDVLNYIYGIFQMGSDKGIKAYLGKSGIKFYRGAVLAETGRKGGKKTGANKKDNLPYHALMRELAVQNKEDLFQILEKDARNLRGFIEHGVVHDLHKKGKIRIRTREVDHGKEEVHFFNPKDESHFKVSFKTLKNLIPKYRKK